MIKNFFSNTLFIGISQGVSKVVLFIFLPFLTIELSTLEFGYLDLITTIIELCSPILTIGISDSILRYAINDKENRKSVFTYTLLIYLIGSLLFSSVTFFFISFVELDYILAINIMYLTYVLRLLSSQLIKSLNKVKLLAISNLVFALTFSFFFFYFYKYQDLTILTYSFIFGGANLLATLSAIGNKSSVKYFSLGNLDTSVLVRMINYGKWLIPNSISWWLISWSNRLLIIYFLGFSYLGVYAVAFRVSGIVNLLTNILQQSWQLTALNEHKNIKNKNRFQLIFDGLVVFMSLLSVFLNYIEIYLVEYFFNDAYLDSSEALPFLLTASIFGLFSMFFGTAYLVNKNSKRAMSTTLIGGLISLTIAVPLIYWIGITGAAFSVSIGYFIIMMMRFKEGLNTFYLEDCRKFPFVAIMILLLLNAFLTVLLQKNLILFIISFIIISVINRKRIKYITSSLIIKI